MIKNIWAESPLNLGASKKIMSSVKYKYQTHAVMQINQLILKTILERIPLLYIIQAHNSNNGKELLAFPQSYNLILLLLSYNFIVENLSL